MSTPTDGTAPATEAATACRCGASRSQDRPERCERGHPWRGLPGPAFRGGLRSGPPADAGSLPEVGDVARLHLRTLHGYLSRLLSHLQERQPSLRDLPRAEAALALIDRAAAMEGKLAFTREAVTTLARVQTEAVLLVVRDRAQREAIAAQYERASIAWPDTVSIPPSVATAGDVAEMLRQDGDMRAQVLDASLLLVRLREDAGLRRGVLRSLQADPATAADVLAVATGTKWDADGDADVDVVFDASTGEVVSIRVGDEDDAA